jgi:hypothetical protein
MWIIAKGKTNTLRFHWLLGIGYFAMAIEIFLAVPLQKRKNRISYGRK